MAKSKAALERKVAALTEDAQRAAQDRARDRERVLELEQRALQALHGAGECGRAEGSARTQKGAEH